MEGNHQKKLGLEIRVVRGAAAKFGSTLAVTCFSTLSRPWKLDAESARVGRGTGDRALLGRLWCEVWQPSTRPVHSLSVQQSRGRLEP
jgi:hypothetical protein